MGPNFISASKTSGICITKPSKEELDQLQKQQIIVSVGIDEKSD